MEGQVAAIEGDFENSPLLTDKEECVIRWAELVTRNEAKHERECREELKTYFSPQEFIELTVIICYFNMMNRLNDALKLDLETPPPGMRSLKIPLQKFRQYVKNILVRGA